MPNFKKTTFTLLSFSVIAGCSFIEDKPTEKDIQAVFKSETSLRGYEDNSEKIVCTSIPSVSDSSASKYYINGLIRETVIPKEYKDFSTIKSYKSFVNVGLMSESEDFAYVQGQLVPAYKYKLTELGAKYFIRKSGGSPCFQLGKIVPGSLIPGLDENGEKEKDLIVKKEAKNKDAKQKYYYQAWVEQKVVDQAAWVSNIGPTDLIPEAKELTRLQAKKVSVAKYADMWLPYSVVEGLMERESKLDGKSQEAVNKFKNVYLEPFIAQYKAANDGVSKEKSISEENIEIIKDLAKNANASYVDYHYYSSSAGDIEYLTLPVKIDSNAINSSTSVQSNTVTIDKVPQFNEDQKLQDELDKYLKANPQSSESALARELKIKINGMRLQKDRELNNAKEFAGNLELLVKYGFASKQENSSAVTYTFKDGVVLTKRQNVTIAQIKAFKYEFGNVLKSQVKEETDVIQRKYRPIEVTVELKAQPLPDIQKLLQENPELYRPYTKAIITGVSTDNPGKPYDISKVTYKQ